MKFHKPASLSWGKERDAKASSMCAFLLLVTNCQVSVSEFHLRSCRLRWFLEGAVIVSAKTSSCVQIAREYFSQSFRTAVNIHKPPPLCFETALVADEPEQRDTGCQCEQLPSSLALSLPLLEMTEHPLHASCWTKDRCGAGVLHSS